MSTLERRKYRRLPIRLDLSCREVGLVAEKFHTGRTVNVSPGGLYFETADKVFKPGEHITVKLSIPPTTGLLESGGSISGMAKVLRTDIVSSSRKDTGSSSGRYGVALEFTQSPKLCM